jgi:hypothetical protein
MTADPCKSSGTCAGGVCGAVGNRADGTSCGTAPDTCHNAPVCKTGACQAAAAKADGTVCLTTANPCQNPGTCKTGVCGPITNADGKVCSNPVDSCHTPGVCMSGMCGAQGTLGQGVSWDGQYQHRCCAGVPVDISTDAANCGGCGIACRNGNACQHVGTAVNAYYCRCTVATDCWSSCCSLGTAYPNTPMVCAASTCPEPGACIACTGQTCALDGANSAYCHY